MKKIGFYILLILFSLSLSSNIFACTVTQEHMEWEKLSAEEKKNTQEPILCEELYTDLDDLKLDVSDLTLNIMKDNSYLDSFLKAADDKVYLTPQVTSVKNQGNTNACWAFATMGMLETLAGIENFGTLDFSEKHLVYNSVRTAFSDATNVDGFNIGFDTGGNYPMAASYFYELKGPVMESEVPYSYTQKAESINNFTGFDRNYIVDDFYYATFEEKSSCTSDQISNLKYLVSQYGSVGVSIYMNNNSPTYVNVDDKDGKYYYSVNNPNISTNHAVIIVGWDDTIEASKFNTATRNGAWIVKNSYGTDFGNDGYFYISYDDVFVCRNLNYYTGIEENNYDKAVYTSPYAFANVGFPDSDQIISASKIVIDNPTYISRVSFYSDANQNYNVYIADKDDFSKNDTNLQYKSLWKMVVENETTGPYGGINTVTFDDYYATDDVYVIIEYLGDSRISNYFCESNDSSSDVYFDGYLKSDNNYTYYSGTNGKGWLDAYSLLKYSSIGSDYYGCAPIVYVYESEESIYCVKALFGDVDSKIYVDDLNTQLDIPVTFSKNFTSITIDDVVDEDNNSYLEKFNIYYEDGYLHINVKESVDAKEYTVLLNIDGSISKYSFFVYPFDLSFKNYELVDDVIIIPIPQSLVVTYDEFISDMNDIGDVSYKIVDEDNNTISSGNLATGYKLISNSFTYYIVIRGDINKDGKISSFDYVKIRNHIMEKNIISDRLQLIAADTNTANSSINAFDYIRIKNYIMNANG